MLTPRLSADEAAGATKNTAARIESTLPMNRNLRIIDPFEKARNGRIGHLRGVVSRGFWA
jgi:hypothetical protein